LAPVLAARCWRERPGTGGSTDAPYVIPDDVKALAVPAPASSRHPVASAADRRALRSGRSCPTLSTRRSAALIYPSGRAVWAAAAGAIPAFPVALALPSFWYLGLLWICVLLAFLAVDAAAGSGRASADASL
jgi:hypothetical protein